MNSPADFHLPYPDWRPGQRLAIRTAHHAKTPHVIIQAPTGSGKSIIAGALAQIGGYRTGILTATNALMQQYERALPWLSVIRGMRNYECLAAKDELKRYFRLVNNQRAITCDDGPCQGDIACTMKEGGCLYFDARKTAAKALRFLTNYSYWLALRRFKSSTSEGLGPVDRLVLDEAHAIPEELMKACRIEIPSREIGRVKPRTRDEWQKWAAWKFGELRKVQGDDEDRRVRRTKLIRAVGELIGIDATIAWECQGDQVVFEPTIPSALRSLLTDSATTVYLSATITPSILNLVGIPDTDITFHSLPSRFDVARRPVYLVRTVRVDYKMSDLERDWWHRTIDQIIGKRLDRKGIIHCVSYERQQEIMRRSQWSGMMFAPSGAELAATVERFKALDRPAILLSPSLTTGWDFPGETCEYQIIVKVPFPDTRSMITKERIKHTERYRESLTMRALVQAVGRGMRSEDDSCETLIIDDHARWFISKNEDLAPGWFLDSVVRVSAVPSPLAKL